MLIPLAVALGILGLFKLSNLPQDCFSRLYVAKHYCLFSFTLRLCGAADSNVAGDDGFDDKGCHCEISVEDLLPSVKSVIRAVR